MSPIPSSQLNRTSVMNTLRLLLTITVVGTCAATGFAAGITEPPSVFYGRIYQRIGDWEFAITEGQISWTIANTTLAGQTYQIQAPLRSNGAEGLGYLFRVPHQVLAYDLTVQSNAAPLTAGGFQFEHRDVRVNGHPALLVAPAVDAFTARQSSRAGTYRIDLEVPDLSPDSDGDGIPDWWEDKYGSDKWDPYEGPDLLLTNPGGDARDTTQDGIMTFAKWRDLHFPGNTSNLDLFGGQDADQDGVVHLVEYAFNLDPNLALEDRGSLPRGRTEDGYFVLQYERRADAEDLTYLVEISFDLLHWSDATDQVEETVEPGEVTSLVEVRQLAPVNETRQAYLRIVVQRNPWPL